MRTREKVYRCPVCGGWEPNTYFYRRPGVIGCNHCMKRKWVETYEEKCPYCGGTDCECYYVAMPSEKPISCDKDTMEFDPDEYALFSGEILKE